MVRDYQDFSATRNLTFIGIDTSRTADPRTMAAQVDEFKLKPFANMLDAAGQTLAAYHVPKNAANWLVVIDPEGKIAYNRSKGWTWSAGPNAGKYVHLTVIEDCLKRSPGILGIPELPGEFDIAAHFFDLQQFPLVNAELKKVSAMHKGNAAHKEFVTKFADRINASRHDRVERIKSLADSDPLQAYREAVAFVQAFADAPEKNEVNQLGQKIVKDKTVKRELAAEDGYKRILVPTMTKTSTIMDFDNNLKPLLVQYDKAFGDTQYAKIVDEAIKAHEDAIRHPNN